MSPDDTMIMAGTVLRIARRIAKVKGRWFILMPLAYMLAALGCVNKSAHREGSPYSFHISRSWAGRDLRPSHAPLKAPFLAEPWLDARAELDSFYLEDEGNMPIPPAARTAIIDHMGETDPWLDSCQFMGRPVDLGSVGRAEDLIASTAAGCGWGNAMGPLWVLRKEGPAYRVLLSDVGYELSFLPHRSKGLPVIKITGSAGGWYEERQWRYTGKRYKKIKGFYVDRSNPEDCRRHPEACE